MEIEVIITMLVAIGSLILGIINAISNHKISSKQNEIELKKTRIEVLERRSKKLEETKDEIFMRKSNVTTMNSLEDLGNLGTFFSENIKKTLNISQLLNEEYVVKLQQANKKFEGFVGVEKIGGNINYDDVRSHISYMNELNENIPTELSNHIIKIQSNIDALLK